MKKHSTGQKPKSESTYAKRQCRRAEKIILASGVYNALFCRSVQGALEQYKKGQPSALPRLIKEADEMYRQRLEFNKELHARMNADLQERQAIRAKAKKVEALVSGPPITSAQLRRSRSAFLKYAVQSLLFELSTESSIGIDGPGIAGIFYMLAASELKDSASETEQRYLRHLDVLLNDPDHKSVKAIMKYWDNGKMDAVILFPLTLKMTRPARSLKGARHVRQSRVSRRPTTRRTLQTLLTCMKDSPSSNTCPKTAVRFKLESDIYRLEQEAVADEWPDVIGATGGNHAN
jgi:hypothetical protein